jgi:hypothetical protein
VRETKRERERDIEGKGGREMGEIYRGKVREGEGEGGIEI